MESLFSLLFLLLLPRPSWLYSLHNCTIESTDPWKINCNYYYKLSRIPPDIPKSVAYLSVYGTNIESICQGDFSGLTELQTLDLGGNHISQIEDAAFSHLSSLTELSLSTNSLKNLTDHMFTGLSNLTVLGLGFNKINHISGLAFAPLTKLLELDLWGNHLSSISDIVKVVSFCPLLKSLDLSGNPLTSIESEQFPFPFNITTLHLASVYNDLQWNISDKAFLKSLMTLDLGFNSFSVKTCQLIFQSLDSLEKLVLNYVYPLDRGLLDMACGIQTLQSLDVYNSENHFINDSLFKLCSNLTELDLSLNHLTDVAPSSLQMLTRLSRLNFSINGLTEVPLTIRNMSSLTSLSFKSNSISKLRCLDFSGLHLLKILDLSYNNIRELNSCVFQDLQNLQELNIRKNLILKFDDSFGTTLPNLLFLDAADNNIKKLQKGVFRNMTHLTDLDLVSQFAPLMSMEKGSFDGLTDLRNLSISPFHISYSPPLQQVFNLPSLQTLRITVYKGSCISLTIDLLKGLDDLKMLSLKGCFIRALDTKMFHHTPRLINLEIRNIRKWTPVPELFQPLTVLQTLDLSENHLKSVDFLSEANLMQLQTLKLQNNDVSVINERVFEAQVYVNGAYQYRCASLPSEQGALLLEFDYRWCWESVGFFCFICSSALVLLTLLLSFLHHFLRFHLQYSFYLLRAFLYHRQQRGQGCAEIYDAFVSYNVHDEEWVYRELLPELEGRQGWKLCLHHRDFEPGDPTNIVDAIYSSRKTLCVISHQYLLSEWCSREIQMARCCSSSHTVSLVIGEVHLTHKRIKIRTYLSWSGARGHRGLFWERVRHALQSGAQLPADNPLPTDD
uniref:TIR domain-containing protein n=1 Tax=Neogobius melanostomus TaxID=47308 RepID=A0A8C6U8H2_9GOBI